MKLARRSRNYSTSRVMCQVSAVCDALLLVASAVLPMWVTLTVAPSEPTSRVNVIVQTLPLIPYKDFRVVLRPRP